MSAPRREGRVRRRWLLPGLAAAALLALWLLRVPLLVGVARLLVRDDPVRRSDLIFLLGGGAEEAVRARHAAALWRAGAAPRIGTARAEDPAAVRLGLYPNDTDVSMRLLRRFGVPDSALFELRPPGGATSTADEAAALRRHLEAHAVRRVIVVTSDYHTARARWIFRRRLAGLGTEVAVSAARDPDIAPHNWWRSERGLLRFVEEYLKFAHNWVYR